MVKTVLVVLIAGFWLAPGAAQSQEGVARAAVPAIKCTCRFQGRDYQLGEHACLKAAGGPQLARCSKVLNNTSWNFTGLACTLARTGSPLKGELAASGLGANRR